jgi:hypothetical protein
MLMKTSIEDFADSGLAIMLMKTHSLISFCHYVDDNTSGYKKACSQFTSL